MEVRPNLYSLEGIDGAGKSTQTARLLTALPEAGHKVVLLRSPDTTLLGNFLRHNVRNLDPWLRNRLFMLDIEASMRTTKDDDETIYLWDRYVDSFYSSNPEMTLPEAQDLTHNLALPRRTYFLDIDPQYIFTERRETLDHHSDPEWLKMKVARYRELAAHHPDRIRTIDARLPKEVITQIIVDDMLDNPNAKR